MKEDERLGRYGVEADVNELWVCAARSHIEHPAPVEGAQVQQIRAVREGVDVLSTPDAVNLLRRRHSRRG